MTMFRRALTATALALVAAAPLMAQNSSDPDKNVNGGALPAGWTGRTDRPNAKLADARFTTMGTGLHVTSGPAAIYWNAGRATTGPFKASATFTQMKAPAHPEAYGLFFMGKKLDANDQDYAYFLVRGDGKVMVKHRAGEAVHTIMDWTDNAAVHKQDAAGKATNTLSVDASKPDSVRLFVNGAPVAALPGSHLGSTDGVVGLRVNHNLDVHIADFAVTPSDAKLGMTKKEKKAVKKAEKKAEKKARG
jgi:hypothetical protein